ncbi:MAG: YkgJ family cysteine cluster protein [Methanobacteriota archaeon]
MRKTIAKKKKTGFQEIINTTIHDFSDCSLCCLCCVEGELHINETEIKRISKQLHITPKSFVKQYVVFNPDTDGLVIRMPCPFLKKNQCIIYSVRPRVCRNFPVFVQKKGIVDINCIEACATATLLFEAYVEYLASFYPDCYQQLEKTLEEEPPLKKDDVRNAHLSREHFELFIRWVNESKK